MTTTSGSSLGHPADNIDQRAREAIASLWWFPLIRGILLLLFGVVMYVWPGATLISLITFLGAYWLVGGIFDLIEGIVGHTTGSRMWLILGGIVSVLAGFVVMARPVMAGLLTGTFLITMLGLAAIVGGIFYFMAGRNRDGMAWGNILLGILYVLFGLMVIFNPFLTEAVMLLLLPLWAIVTGIFSIVMAFMVRSVGNPA